MRLPTFLLIVFLTCAGSPVEVSEGGLPDGAYLLPNYPAAHEWLSGRGPVFLTRSAEPPETGLSSPRSDPP